MDDNKIIELLFDRSESALSEIAQKYAGLYKSIARKILRNESDAEECANDVLLALWNSIPPNHPNNLSAYICTLSRRICVDKIRYNTRLKRNNDYTVMLSELDECMPAAPSEECDEDVIRILNDFVRALSPDVRVLFLRRYVYLESVAELARRFELPENTVSAKLYRARKRLQKILEKEGLGI